MTNKYKPITESSTRKSVKDGMQKKEGATYKTTIKPKSPPPPIKKR